MIEKVSMSTKLLVAVGWLVGTVSLLGCHESDSPDPPDDTNAGAKSSAMVELETDLPSVWKEKPIPRRKQGEPFLVPQGTKLLSRGVKVTSSQELPVIGELEMITDGNEGAPDGGFYAYVVGLGPGLQWVQLDLGKPHALHAILVWRDYWKYNTFHGEYTQYRRVYRDVVVQVSNDPAFKKDVKTVFNNDHDNSSGLGKGKDDTYVETSEGRWIDPKGVEGRYVRLYSRGHKRQWRGGGGRDFDMYKEYNQYIEVEVYGK